MKKIIHKALKLSGYRLLKINETKEKIPVDHIIPEIKKDEQALIETAMKYSMTNPERMWAIIQAMKIIARNKIDGDLVETGVWRGGNLLLFSKMSDKLGLQKKIWAYDTYEGMSEPTEKDISYKGTDSRDLLAKHPKILDGDSHNIWCYASLDDVRNNLKRHMDDIGRINFVQGKVEETLLNKENIPNKIALLRIDTDWYESTKIGLEVLFPRLVPGGILILDDYGHWKGAKNATDEYFKGKTPIFHRVDYTCRLLINDAAHLD